MPTLVMSRDNAWMDELTAEHGRHVDYEDGTTLVRIFESGFLIQQGEGAWWPTAGWTNKNSAMARRGVERFLEIRVQQAKAAVDAARQALEVDYAAYVQSGFTVDDIEGRKAELAALHTAFLDAKDEYRVRIEEPIEKQQQRQRKDEERRQAVIAARQKEIYADLQSLSQFKTDAP